MGVLHDFVAPGLERGVIIKVRLVLGGGGSGRVEKMIRKKLLKLRRAGL